MIERLLTEPHPIKIRLKKDLPYMAEWKPRHEGEDPYFVCILAQGETGEYFSHTDVYIFRERDGIVPWYKREVLARLDDWVGVGE